MRLVLGKIRKILGKHNNKHTKVLFLTNIRFAESKPQENQMFGSIIKELNKNKISNKVLRYEELNQINNLKRFIKKFMFQKESYIGDYYTLKHFFRCEKDFKLLKRIWLKIKNKKEFKEIFTYKGYNFYEIIKPRLELIFTALSYIACDAKHFTEAIIKKENYKILILDHEENLYGKAFMLNTRLDKTKKTVALSYELIYPGCSSTFLKNKNVLDKTSFLWRPLPDVKAVSNKYSKKILINSCNYPMKNIKKLGNPKFDSIFRNEYNKNNIIKKYGLNKSKTILLCALFGKNLSYLEELEKISRELDIEILIKPHPTEIQLNIIKEKIYKMNNQNMKYIDNVANIYPLIFTADYIFVNDPTTVALEALLFNKIVLFLDENKINVSDYTYTRLSTNYAEIKNYQDLKKELIKLKNKNYREKQLRKIKKFRRGIQLKKDGKSSERIVLEINRLMK